MSIGYHSVSAYGLLFAGIRQLRIPTKEEKMKYTPNDEVVLAVIDAIVAIATAYFKYRGNETTSN